MANKNSSIRKRAIAIAARESFRKDRKRGGLLVISKNQKRNMQQVCYRNFGGGSITQHIPIEAGRARPKNHGYLENRYHAFVTPSGATKSRAEAPAEGFEFNNQVIHV